MTTHHQRVKHSTKAPKVRELIASRLPLPCVDCGNAVQAGQAWHVGHRIPASQGGQTTVENCGPSHVRCNLKAGGRLGARARNNNTKLSKNIRPW